MAKENPIRGVLGEELQSSRRMLERYRRELEQLPKGALVVKKIKGKVFHYLARREGAKVRFAYQGRLNEAALASQKAVQQKRRQYRDLIADLKGQIRFLERVLHERKRTSI